MVVSSSVECSEVKWRVMDGGVEWCGVLRSVV